MPIDILSSANPWLQGLGITPPPGAGNSFDGFSFGNNIPSWGVNPPPYLPNNNFDYNSVPQQNWPVTPIQQPQPSLFPQNNLMINNDVERIGEFPHYATNIQKSTYWQQQQNMAAAGSQSPIPASGSDPYDANAGTWQTNITGTVFGGKDDRNQSKYDENFLINENTRGASIPGDNLLGKWIEIRRRDSGKSIVAPIIDAGPHYPIYHKNTGQNEYDPYWETNSRPRAEIEQPNKSGIDLALKTADDLGIRHGTVIIKHNNKLQKVPWADELQFDWRFVNSPAKKVK